MPTVTAVAIYKLWFSQNESWNWPLKKSSPRGEQENLDLTRGDQITPTSDIHKLSRASRSELDKLKFGRAGRARGCLQRFPSGKLNVIILYLVWVSACLGFEIVSP